MIPFNRKVGRKRMFFCCQLELKVTYVVGYNLKIMKLESSRFGSNTIYALLGISDLGYD